MSISPESDYCLMGAASCLDITPDIYHGAYLSRLDVDGLIDRQAYGQDSFADQVEQAVLRWRGSASVEHRVFMAVRGFVDSRVQIVDAVDSVVNLLIDCNLRSRGIVHPFDISRRMPDIETDTTGEAIEKCIFFYKINGWARKLGQQHDRILEVVNESSDLRLVDQTRPFQDADHDDLEIIRLSKRDKRQVRRSINRGIKTFTKTFGVRDIQAFISQQKVVIEGVRYDYLLENEGNILRHTKEMYGGVPFRLIICDKTGNQLASACIYVSKTPILDQVMILALNVKEPESEIEFLRTANLMYFKEHHGSIVEAKVDSENFVLPILDTPSGMDTFNRRCDQYNAERNIIRGQMEIHRPSIVTRIQELTEIPSSVFDIMMQEHQIDEQLISQMKQMAVA